MTMNAVTKIEDGQRVGDDAVKVDLEAPTHPAAPAPSQVNLAPPAPAPRPRRGGRVLLMLALPLALAAGGGWYWITGGRIQETENANLRQARVTISSETAGRIVDMRVAENMKVKAGDVLFAVDPEPYRIALAQADAALAQARLQVEQLRAAYGQAQTQAKTAAGDVAYYTDQLARQKELSGKGVTTKAALDSAERDLLKAQDAAATAAESISSALAALGGDPNIVTDKHPAVLAAFAARDKAAYQLAQTTVRAPADGTVSQASSFKLGQFVTAGTSLFTLVETSDTWVEANFKETQLTHMKVGQEAEVMLDTFPDRPLKATIESIGAGTGAEFSLLPAQNATGNWVKVTQRIPVRLKVSSEDADLLLRTGMSATVAVDTGVSRGFGDLIPSAFAGTAKK
ncbi:membrane fusion protein, multidrug efflux system [Mesorhizobium australicum]|uniref:Membrane fusion protein, multidrug efflux system n=2 Tax=Mesorhizobium australicum TaxID=536018 RepID=A0A1X7N5M3_9HYPH|nr:membrane fusion protein, multidrug efflux system [Mesorhizobium australicum]